MLTYLLYAEVKTRNVNKSRIVKKYTSYLLNDFEINFQHSGNDNFKSHKKSGFYPVPEKYLQSCQINLIP